MIDELIIQLVFTLQEAHNIFDGYCKAEPTFSKYADKVVDSLFLVLGEKSLPYEQMQQRLAVMKSRIKPTLWNKLNEFVSQQTGDFPVKAIQYAIDVRIFFRILSK